MLSFDVPVEEVFGLVAGSGGDQSGVLIRAFNFAGQQIGSDQWNDYLATDEDWRFTLPDGQRISRVEFWDHSLGFGLDTFSFTVPEPGTGLLVSTGLLGLAVRRRAA